MSSSLQLLLLEDNVDDALLLRELLQRSYGSDMTLDHAATAVEATALVQKKAYDLFLVDYMLDEESTGAEWITQTAKTISMPPTIMLTGLPDARRIEGVAGQLPEVAYFLTKNNLTMADITQAVNFALVNQFPQDMNKGTILLADDDADDVMLIEDALLELPHPFKFDAVGDGAELMDYLHRRGKYVGLQREPLPGLILLDMNMPKKDGRQVLAEIRKDARLRHIPVVVISTSSAEQDVYDGYDLGANSFITKPNSFDELVELMHKLTTYWFNLVALPDQHSL